MVIRLADGLLLAVNLNRETAAPASRLPPPRCRRHLPPVWPRRGDAPPRTSHIPPTGSRALEADDRPTARISRAGARYLTPPKPGAKSRGGRGGPTISRDRSKIPVSAAPADARHVGC